MPSFTRDSASLWCKDNVLFANGSLEANNINSTIYSHSPSDFVQSRSSRDASIRCTRRERSSLTKESKCTDTTTSYCNADELKGTRGKEVHNLPLSRTSLQCYKFPTITEVNERLAEFESKRLAFNAIHGISGTSGRMKRQDAVRQLADHLYMMSRVVFENIVFRPQTLDARALSQKPPSSSAWSWLGSVAGVLLAEEQITDQDYSVDRDDGYELSYEGKGLTVWKKDFGSNRIVVRGEFIIPVTPKEYCSYASDITRRQEWDTNVSEARLIEQIDDTVDICYIAFKRVATIYPRDCINVRVIRELDAFGSFRNDYSATTRMSSSYGNKKKSHLNNQLFHRSHSQNVTDEDGIPPQYDCAGKAQGSCTSDGISGVYCSCSCSIEHPEIAIQPGKVRADVKVGCYLAEPVYLSGSRASESWSKVYMFSEIDPRGWLPATVTKHLSARVLPGSVERIVSCILKHYNINWKGTKLYCDSSGEAKLCQTALEYCAAKYAGTIVPEPDTLSL